MPDISIAVDTDPSEYPEQANQGLVNGYVVPASKDGAREAEIRFTPGLTEAVDTGDNICRGGIGVISDKPTNDVAYFVFEGATYKITWDGSTFTSANIGIIPGHDKVTMARNTADPHQVGVVSDGKLYVIESDTISLGPTSGMPDFNSIARAGQHIILGVDDGRMFATNLLNMKSINGLDFATAEADPDGLVAVAGLGPELFPMGRNTVEAWRQNAETTGFPFSQFGGTASQYGCIGRYAITTADNSLFWVTNTGFAARMVNYGPQKVSNDAFDLAVSKVSDPETIEAYSYFTAGRHFIGFTHDDFTWEMNVATGLWHERRSVGLKRWRGTATINVFGKTLCADYLNGKIWEYDRNARTEGSDEVVFEGRCAPIASGGVTRTIRRIEVDAVTGRAAISGTTSQTAPVMMVDWTDDGHQPYVGQRRLSLGQIGQRGLEMVSNRLGAVRRGKSRTFRLRCSDPVVTGLKGKIRVY